MILVDAGVLIDFLRSKDAKLSNLFRSLPMAICGVTRAEILAGARGSKDRQRLLRFPTMQGILPGLQPFHEPP